MKKIEMFKMKKGKKKKMTITLIIYHYWFKNTYINQSLLTISYIIRKLSFLLQLKGVLIYITPHELCLVKTSLRHKLEVHKVRAIFVFCDAKWMSHWLPLDGTSIHSSISWYPLQPWGLRQFNADKQKYLV